MKKHVLFAAIALLSCGCASYRAANLSALPPNLIQESKELPGVSIGCKPFSLADCETFLDRDVLKKGYQPIELTFYNKTDQTYFFSTKNLSLPCVPAQEVANKVHTSTVGRVLGYSVGALFIPMLIVPAVVDGICSHNANKRLDKDFDHKTNSYFFLAPHSYRETIVFIPKNEFSPNFDLTLVEQETQQSKTTRITAGG